MKSAHLCFGVMTGALLLAGCAIEKSVSPVSSRPDEVCLVRNDQVMMGGFHTELARQIEARGVAVRDVEDGSAAGCRYRVTYTANWTWDMAMYLSYARITVLDGTNEIGNAEYDATQGSMNMTKFGPTSAKIEPLVSQLFG